MKFQIGAMTVGDILDRGLKLLFGNLFAFYVINLMVLAPSIAVQVFLPDLLANLQSGGPDDQMQAALLVMAFSFLGLGLIIILQPIGTAAILHIIASDFVDRRVTIGEALKFALGRFGSLLLTSILLGLIVMFGILLCIVPGILFWIWYIFYAQVVVVEDLSGNAALSRSKTLTEGYRGRIFGLMALFVVGLIIFGGAQRLLESVYPSHEFVPAGGAAARNAPVNPFAPPPVVVKTIYPNYYINTLLAQLASILLTTYGAVCITLLYFDLRIRKEGFDLEFVATQQPPSPIM